MSLKTWLEEYYPITAVEAAHKGLLHAVNHSLKKWEGLRKENLSRHEIYLSESLQLVGITHDCKEDFFIDAETCSLCEYVELSLPDSEVQINETFDYSECQFCILYKIRNGTPCCVKKSSELYSPYKELHFNKDPEPMIQLLTKAKEQVEKRK